MRYDTTAITCHYVRGQYSQYTFQIEIYSVELKFIFYFVQSCAWFGLVALTKVSVAPAVRDLTCIRLTAYNIHLITPHFQHITLALLRQYIGSQLSQDQNLTNCFLFQARQILRYVNGYPRLRYCATQTTVSIAAFSPTRNSLFQYFFLSSPHHPPFAANTLYSEAQFTHCH